MNMTSEILFGAGALVFGVGVGILYFGGLWKTVQAMAGSQRPTLLFLGSFVARNALLAAGAIGLAMVSDWYHLSVFLIGIIAARMYLTRREHP